MRSMGRGSLFFQSRTDVIAVPYQCIGTSRSRRSTLVVIVTVLLFEHVLLWRIHCKLNPICGSNARIILSTCPICASRSRNLPSSPYSV